MSKSVLVMETPENCYVCPFGTAYCSALEYEGLCELADCLDCDVILITEEHYDCESKSRPDWCPLNPLPEKLGCFHFARIGESPSYDIGWNDCLDAIKGGTNERK
jgi:hypothetical protein